MSALGQKRKRSKRAHHVRFVSQSGHRERASICPFSGNKDWSAPLGVDRYEAVQLAICRACSSSKLTGLLYPSAEWRRLALYTSSMKRGKEAATSSKASYSMR